MSWLDWNPGGNHHLSLAEDYGWWTVVLSRRSRQGDVLACLSQHSLRVCLHSCLIAKLCISLVWFSFLWFYVCFLNSFIYLFFSVWSLALNGYFLQKLNALSIATLVLFPLSAPAKLVTWYSCKMYGSVRSNGLTNWYLFNDLISGESFLFSSAHFGWCFSVCVIACSFSRKCLGNSSDCWMILHKETNCCVPRMHSSRASTSTWNTDRYSAKIWADRFVSLL
jgi:hypothetical protein